MVETTSNILNSARTFAFAILEQSIRFWLHIMYNNNEFGDLWEENMSCLFIFRNLCGLYCMSYHKQPVFCVNITYNYCSYIVMTISSVL